MSTEHGVATSVVSLWHTGVKSEVLWCRVGISLVPKSNKNKDTKVERVRIGCGVRSNINARLAMGRVRIDQGNSRLKNALAKRRLSKNTVLSSRDKLFVSVALFPIVNVLQHCQVGVALSSFFLVLHVMTIEEIVKAFVRALRRPSLFHFLPQRCKVLSWDSRISLSARPLYIYT